MCVIVCVCGGGGDGGDGGGGGGDVRVCVTIKKVPDEWQARLTSDTGDTSNE